MKLEDFIWELEDRDFELDRTALINLLSEIKEIPYETVVDQMKAEFILENWDKITLEQLEGLVK